MSNLRRPCKEEQKYACEKVRKREREKERKRERERERERGEE
jgi:hypothetical protein